MKGQFSGGILPYGYYVENKKVFIDEERAEIVRFIFQQYAEGTTVKEIIRKLTEKGLTYRGKPFAMNTVYQMLRLEKYIGICRYDEGVYDNIFPAIVPKYIYEDVQKILQTNKKGSKSTRTEFLLKGKLLCGYCGKNMHGDSGTSHTGKTMHYYNCMARKRNNSCNKSAVSKDKFEKLITDTTVQLFEDQSNIDLIANEIMNVHKTRMNKKSVLSILENQREEIKRSLANIMKAVEKGIFNATTQSRMEELEKQLADVESNIAIEQYKEKTILTKENIIDFLTNAILQKPKKMLQTLIQKIVVYDDKIIIYYNFTDKTNPDESNHRDSFYYPGSDSSVMVDRNHTNSNTQFQFSDKWFCVTVPIPQKL